MRLFWKNDMGQLCLGPMHIVGGWIPWFGFRREEVEVLDAVAMGIIDYPVTANFVMIEALSVEWFGAGVLLMAKVIGYR